MSTGNDAEIVEKVARAIEPNAFLAGAFPIEKRNAMFRARSAIGAIRLALIEGHHFETAERLERVLFNPVKVE